MTKTINQYVPDQGEVVITISAGDVTALSAFTTAENITLDGTVISFERTQTPTRTVIEQKVTGDLSPVSAAGDAVGSEQWTLTLIDDYSLGAAGEWGTDTLAAVEIFKAFFDGRREISALEVTPAGSGSAMITTILDDPIEVLSITKPVTNAEANQFARCVIVLSCPSSTEAAHG